MTSNFSDSHAKQFSPHFRGALFAWACLADKPWLKVLLADLV